VFFSNCKKVGHIDQSQPELWLGTDSPNIGYKDLKISALLLSSTISNKFLANENFDYKHFRISSGIQPSKKNHESVLVLRDILLFLA